MDCEKSNNFISSLDQILFSFQSPLLTLAWPRARRGYFYGRRPIRLSSQTLTARSPSKSHIPVSILSNEVIPNQTNHLFIADLTPWATFLPPSDVTGLISVSPSSTLTLATTVTRFFTSLRAQSGRRIRRESI